MSRGDGTPEWALRFPSFSLDQRPNEHIRQRTDIPRAVEVKSEARLLDDRPENQFFANGIIPTRMSVYPQCVTVAVDEFVHTPVSSRGKGPWKSIRHGGFHSEEHARRNLPMLSLETLQDSKAVKGIDRDVDRVSVPRIDDESLIDFRVAIFYSSSDRSTNDFLPFSVSPATAHRFT